MLLVSACNALLRCDYHEIVTSLSARNATNAEAIAASIAPPATMRPIVALRSADRVFSVTLRIASKPCAAITASERLGRTYLPMAMSD